MRLLLVRHGETTLSAEDRFAGSTDVPLGERGRHQVERLRDRLADLTIAAAYCSPMMRTVDTAECLAAPHGLTVVRLDALREIDHGHWEGLTRDEVETKYPVEYAAWEADPFTVAPQGGETGASVVARALPAIRHMVIQHPGQHVLVVSHKATIRLVIASLLGFDVRSYRDRLDQSPASLNVLDFKDHVHARLMLFNDVSHYAAKPAPAARRLSKWWDAPHDH